jgi:hypothetical protein
MKKAIVEYKLFIGKHEKGRTLARPKRRGMNNIKIKLGVLCGGVW